MVRALAGYRPLLFRGRASRLLRPSRDLPRNQLLVRRLAHTRMWRGLSEELHQHFADVGYLVERPDLEVLSSYSWARLTDTFEISCEGASVEVLHDISVRHDGTVMNVMAILRPHPGREPSSQDLVTLSSTRVGRLQWSRAQRGPAYSFAQLLAQLRDMRAFEPGLSWAARVRALSQTFEP